MYFVSLNYVKPVEDVDRYLEAHRSFLDNQFAQERFLAAGAKTPRTGGVFLIRGIVSVAELNQLIEQDPFHQNGIAEYEIIAFTPSKYHRALEDFL